MRKLLRSIARHNMKKAGIEQMNKKRVSTNKGKKSIFALYWKQYIKPQVATKKRKSNKPKVQKALARA